MRRPALVALVALALRLWLIFQFPIVFGGDSMLRLVHRDQVLLSYQLPLLQCFIWLLTRVTPGTLAVRLMMAVIGALAAVAFYYLAAELAGPRAALLGALLLATNPYITPVSTVPYQEILLLATLFAAFFFFFRRRWIAAAVFLALACLTRFEAWVACPVLAAAYFLDGPRTLRRAATGIALFGAAPVLWILARNGLSPQGSFVLDRSITLARFARYGFLAAHVAAEGTIPALLLAVAGLAGLRDRRFAILGAFLGLFAVAILFSAHGELPDPERIVTTREIHIPLAGVLLLAALGCARYPRLAVPLALAGMVWGIWGSYAFVRHETARPEMRLGYDVARYLDAHVAPGEQVLICARPPNVDLYFRKALETGGPAGLAAARRAVEAIDILPVDAQRTIVHLNRVTRAQVFTYPSLPAHADWAAVWSDFALAADPVATFRIDGRSVAVLRRPAAIPIPTPRSGSSP
jgi:Dolichyl-phosphate-mannose-protein mannosyltransferase